MKFLCYTITLLIITVSCLAKTTEQLADAIRKSGYKIENALPESYVKNGSIDYTSYIQMALDKHDDLIFPAFPILINDKGLSIGSNKKILFEKGSEIRLKASSLGKYKMLYLKNSSNVILINPVIKGDRYTHLGTEGEHGIGISINGGNNISIINLVVKETWGDGIYIGAYNNTPPKNILIDKAFITKAGRNGLTIITGININVINMYCEYADRIDPRAGVDIEPNNPLDELKNIRIINPKTYKNGDIGISIGLSKLYKGVSFEPKNISIEILNHVDDGSVHGIWLSTAAKSKSNTIVSGTLTFTNPQWKNNQLAIRGITWIEPNIVFTLLNPKISSIKNSKQAMLSAAEMDSLFKKNLGPVTFKPVYKTR